MGQSETVLLERENVIVLNLKICDKSLGYYFFFLKLLWDKLSHDKIKILRMIIILENMDYSLYINYYDYFFMSHFNHDFFFLSDMHAARV